MLKVGRTGCSKKENRELGMVLVSEALSIKSDKFGISELWI